MSFLRDLMRERKSPHQLRPGIFQVAGSPAANAEEEATTAVPTEEAAASAAPEAATSPAPADMAVTETPVPAGSLTTTTSLVMSTSAGSSPVVRKSRMSKLDAANEYVYGPKEDAWTRPGIPPSTEPANNIRPNRAHTMRRSCILKRVQEEERERAQLEHRPAERRKESEEDAVEQEAAAPARLIPQTLYEKPKISVRETKSSKFRYWYNRKPAGVTVYFKPANAVARKKPPFVVAAPMRTCV